MKRKIAILSKGIHLYSTRRLVMEGEARNWQMEIIDPLECKIAMDSNSSSIWYQQKKLTAFSAVIPRIGASATFYGLALLRQFEILGVYTLNSSLGIGRSRDKLWATQLMYQHQIPIPQTAFSSPGDDNGDLVKLVGGAPLVVKLLQGSQGKGVVLAETNEAAESVIDAYRAMNANFLVQEYLREAAGRDIRSLVIGGRVITSMMRVAQKGEFRSNYHLGAKVESIDIDSQEEKMVVGAALAMGLNVAGVDFIRSQQGPKLLEVNSSPGLEGIEKASNLNIAGMIIDFLCQKI